MKLINPPVIANLIACCMIWLLHAAQVFADHNSPASIASRIAPVGHVCVAGQTCKEAVEEMR